MSATPLVSVGLPVYNEEAYVAKALDSVLCQELGDFELIISDNASTDGTREICLDYAARDPRISYHRNEVNIGGVENFNTAFRLSSGEYFAWIGAHDKWHPQFLARCAVVLNADPDVVLCYPQALLIDRDDTPLGTMPHSLDTRNFDPLSRFNLALWGLVNGNHVYGLMRSSALKRTRLLQRLFGPDLVLLAELCLLGPFAQVPEPLFLRRKVREEETRDQRVQRWINSLRLRKGNGRIWLPHWRLAYEYVRVALRSPVRRRTKGPLVLSALLHSLLASYRGLAYDLRHGLRY